MRQIPDGLAAHLAVGATTLARCWRLIRRDGTILGFTDHDRALEFDGTTYEPAAGFTASEIPASIGLSVDTAELVGALVSPTLVEDDLAAGLYDGARVELWLVNWSAPKDRILLDVGDIGEITREGAAFKAETRALSHRLDQERGRIYQAGCDADLGDARCGVDLADYTRDAVVTAITGQRRLEIIGASDLAAGILARGRVKFTSGANAGLAVEIRDDRATENARLLDLWESPPRPVAVGDTVQVTAGCDKSFETCHQRFANALNFRGFPHMPGNDFALSYPRRGAGNDGGKLV